MNFRPHLGIILFYWSNKHLLYHSNNTVSVPIRGLLNLTLKQKHYQLAFNWVNAFPSPLGDYLI